MRPDDTLYAPSFPSSDRKATISASSSFLRLAVSPGGMSETGLIVWDAISLLETTML